MPYRSFFQLRYSLEAVAAYWDNPDYRIFSLQMGTDGRLCFMTSNPANSQLFHGKIQLNVDVRETLEKDQADRLYYSCTRWLEKQKTASYINIFDDCTVAWHTTVEVKNNMLFGIGRKGGCQCERGISSFKPN